MSVTDMQSHPGLYFIRYEKVNLPVGLSAEVSRTFRKGVVKDRVKRVQSFGPSFMHRTAYNLQGDYIGSVERARFLCNKLGIVPEKINPDRKVCRIGKSLRDGKWYGWSHRAICAFTIGDVIKKDGDFGRYLTLNNDLRIDSEALARDMAAMFAEMVS